MSRVLDWLEEQYAERPGRLAAREVLEGRMDHEAWKKALRGKIESAIGIFPSCPLDVETVYSLKRDGYIQRKITFAAMPGLRLPGFLLIPKEAGSNHPCPGVVCNAGHGDGMTSLVGMTSGETLQEEPDFYNHFAISLVKKGCVVIVPEVMGFGQLRMPHGYDEQSPFSCQSIGGYLTQLGKTITGARVHIARRALEVLESLDMVKKGALGMMGLSTGGTITAFSSALDDRVAGCVVAGYASEWKASILGMHHCGCNYVPGLLEYCELYDLLSLIAPRPMLWESGVGDPIFPIDSVVRAQGHVQEMYAYLGAEAGFTWDYFLGGHEVSGAKSYSFLLNALNEAGLAHRA